MAAGIGALATTTLAGCIGEFPADGTDSAGNPATDEDAAVLYTAQNDPVGTVAIQQEGSRLAVTFDTSGWGWEISEAYLHVGSAISDIPVSTDGNPQIHDFEWTTNPDSPIDTAVFSDVAIDNSLERVVVAGHAEVQRGFQTTDVWAGTEPIPDTANWARYFEHDLAAFEPPISDVPGISGRIVQSDGALGINDRLTLLGPQDGSPDFDTVYTDENGVFGATVPEPGTYSLGYYQRTQRNANTPERDGSPDVYKLGPVDVGDDVTELGTIELPDAHVLDVRVVDETGTPVEGAPVNFYAESWGIGRSDTTNADGYFQYEGLGETGIELLGEVRIQVWEPGVDPEPGNYTTQRRIELDGARIEEFVLGRGASGEHEISGTIYRPDGELATGDRLQVRGPRRSNDHPTEEYRTSTDHGGYFNAEVENPGSYALGYIQQQDDDSSSPERDGTPDIYHFDLVDIDGVVDLGNVELPRAHVLDVRVVDGSGNPIRGAPVSVWSCTDDGTSCWGLGPRETNVDGYFQYDGLGESGAELVEHVMIQVWSPDVAGPTFDNIAEEREFDLTESRTEEFVLDG